MNCKIIGIYLAAAALAVACGENNTSRGTGDAPPVVADEVSDSTAQDGDTVGDSGFSDSSVAASDLSGGLTPAESIAMNNAGGFAGNPSPEVPFEQLPGAPCESGEAVTFNEVQNIFAVTCNVLGTCHSSSDVGAVAGGMVSSAAAGLDLSTTEAAYASLMRPATASDGDLVVAGDPDASVLIQRLKGDTAGAQMPQNGTPLPEEVIDRIRQWVSDGANPPVPASCNVATDPPAGAPTFTMVYDQIIRPGCGGVWCHDPYQSPDERRLDTSTRALAYEDLVNQASVCAGGGSAMLRVAPGAPEDSLLVHKLLGTACGLPMPIDLFGAPQPVTEAQLQMVVDWIAAGAPDN